MRASLAGEANAGSCPELTIPKGDNLPGRVLEVQDMRNRMAVRPLHIGEVQRTRAAAKHGPMNCRRMVVSLVRRAAKLAKAPRRSTRAICAKVAVKAAFDPAVHVLANDIRLIFAVEEHA